MDGGMKPTAYKIKINTAGDRFVCLANGQIIPADIAGLAAGPDKWLSEIELKCRDCKTLLPLKELHGNGQWCEPCQVASLPQEEIA